MYERTFFYQTSRHFNLLETLLDREDLAVRVQSIGLVRGEMPFSRADRVVLKAAAMAIRNLNNTSPFLYTLINS